LGENGDKLSRVPIALTRIILVCGELIENTLWFQWLAKFFDDATQELLMR